MAHMGGNSLRSVVVTDAAREGGLVYGMSRCLYAPATSTESSRRPIPNVTSTTKVQQDYHHSFATRNTNNNSKYNAHQQQQQQLTATAEPVAAIAMGVLTGDETESEAEEWIRHFFSVAMQERLSDDRALLLALDHLEGEAQKSMGIGVTTLKGFFEAFCRAFSRHDCAYSCSGSYEASHVRFSGREEEDGAGDGASSSVLRKLVLQMMQRFAHMQKTSCVRFSHRELAFATNIFSKTNLLGENEIGCIYQGSLVDKRPVAVRRLKKPICCGKATIEQLQREVTTLSMIRHRNLLKLLGCCLEPDEPLLVYELEPKGSLMHHLQRGSGCPLDLETRLMIAVGTADGLAHLHHACTPPLLHKNLKSSNILLDKDLRPKIIDFGISRSMFQKDFCPLSETRIGYIDPIYVQTYRFTEKSDVYSFGVILMELVTGQKPVDFTRPPGEITLAALAFAKKKNGYATLADLLDPELQMWGSIFTATLHDTVLLALKCMALDVDTRPTMQQVADQLRMIQDREVIRRKRRDNEYMREFAVC